MKWNFAHEPCFWYSVDLGLDLFFVNHLASFRFFEIVNNFLQLQNNLMYLNSFAISLQFLTVSNILKDKFQPIKLNTSSWSIENCCWFVLKSKNLLFYFSYKNKNKLKVKKQ